MVHWRIFLNWCEVSNTPAALDKMPFDGFFQRKSRKVSADDDLLVTCGIQVVSSLSAVGGSWSAPATQMWGLRLDSTTGGELTVDVVSIRTI